MESKTSEILLNLDNISELEADESPRPIEVRPEKLNIEPHL